MKWFILIAFSIHASANDNDNLLSKIERLDSFAFGSCNREYLPQPLWEFVIKDNPQLFLWGGDNIYADKDPLKDQVQKKYIIQNNIPTYQKMKRTIPIIGIWDDHDFGKNNAGSEFEYKDLYQKLHLDFMEVSKNSPRRAMKGIYHTVDIGKNPTQVKFIMLDTRYFRTEKTMLGKEQWQWLKKQMKESNADLNFIVSGTPVTTPEIFRSEEWADYPKDKKRMTKILRKYPRKNIIILSGDKHFSAVIQDDKRHEIMSSGMTHSPFVIYHPILKMLYDRPALKPNYSLIDIDWNKQIINIKFQMTDSKIRHKIPFNINTID